MSPMRFQPGMDIGPYVVEGLLGQGGMGEVYRAHDPRLGRAVAIKVLPDDFASDFERLRRFDQEAKILAQLSHPNIVQVHDVGIHEGAPYLVMELLEGQSLRAFMGRGPLSPRKAAEVGAQIAEALAAVHARGILHRDLKPENVFVAKDGKVKVLDFGLAKKRQGLSAGLESETRSMAATGESVVMGTVGYMAPEQIQGKAVDSRADLFALGTLLWEMLAGERPFRGEHSVDTLHAILNQDLPDLPLHLGVSPYLERIVRRCLEKEPGARFQSAKDLVFALESAQGQNSSAGHAVPGSEAQAPGLFRRRPWLLWCAGVGLAAAGFLAWMARPQGTAASPRYSRITASPGFIQTAHYSPDGKTIFYSATTSDQDPTLHLFRSGPGDPFPIALGQIGKVLAVSNEGEIFFTDQGIASNPSASDTSTLYRWHGSGTQPKAWVRDISEADVTPDGRQVAVVRMPLPSMGSEVSLECPPGRILFKSTSWLSSPRFSPDGRWIAFVNRGRTDGWPGEIIVLDLEGKVRFRSPWIPRIRDLAWSPSGREVLFTGKDDQGDFIAAWGLKGEVQTRLKGPGDLYLADVSSAGQLLVMSNRGWGGLSRGDASGWKRVPLPFDIWWGGVNRDGSQMVCTTWENPQAQPAAYLVHLADLQVTRIAPSAFGFCLSSDSKKVLIQKYPGNARSMQPADVVLTAVPVQAGEEVPYATKGLKEINPASAMFLPGDRKVYAQGWMANGFQPYLLDPDAEPCPIPLPFQPTAFTVLMPLEPGLYALSREGWIWAPWDHLQFRKQPFLKSTDRPMAWDPATDELVLLSVPVPSGANPLPDLTLQDLRMERINLKTGVRRPGQHLPGRPALQWMPVVPGRASSPIYAVESNLRGDLYTVDGVLTH